MFDSGPAHRVSQELLAMTPGTNQFAARLRAITLKLDADQAKLDGAIEENKTRLARSPSGGRHKGSTDAQ
jgi:hypothetical protein